MLVASKGKINPNVIGSAVDNFVFEAALSTQIAQVMASRKIYRLLGTTDASMQPTKIEGCITVARCFSASQPGIINALSIP